MPLVVMFNNDMVILYLVRKSTLFWFDIKNGNSLFGEKKSTLLSAAFAF
jgi:hypothetical protein